MNKKVSRIPIAMQNNMDVFTILCDGPSHQLIQAFLAFETIIFRNFRLLKFLAFPNQKFETLLRTGKAVVQQVFLRGNKCSGMKNLKG